MELIFKMPTFYKNQYGTDAEIDEFCEAICRIAKQKEYSTQVNRIDIIPVIIPKELISQGKGREFTKIELNYKALSMSKQIDFNKYQNCILREKKILLVNCLIEALKEVEKKICFNVDDFRKDIEELL